MPIRNNAEQEKYEKKCELLAKARLARASKLLMKNDVVDEKVMQVEQEPVREPVKKVRKSKAKVQSDMPEPALPEPEPEVEIKVELPEVEIEPKVKKTRAAPKKKEQSKTLELNLEIKEEEPEIVEVIEVRKIKKPKKLVKKIIQEQYETDSEEEVIEEKVLPAKQKVKKEKREIQPIVKPNDSFSFNKLSSNSQFSF